MYKSITIGQSVSHQVTKVGIEQLKMLWDEGPFQDLIHSSVTNHNSCSKSEQHHQCNSGQHRKTTIIKWQYVVRSCFVWLSFLNNSFLSQAGLCALSRVCDLSCALFAPSPQIANYDCSGGRLLLLRVRAMKHWKRINSQWHWKWLL